MKIELSKDEYRNLLDLLYMGEWMLDAHDDVQDSKKQKYGIAIQKFYSYAKEMGFENLIIYDEELEQYFPTREYEDKTTSRKYIDEYDNDSFWDELVSRLMERDIQKMIINGLIKPPTTGEERLRIGHPIETKYYDEFEKNGLDNVVIKNDISLNQIN